MLQHRTGALCCSYLRTPQKKPAESTSLQQERALTTTYKTSQQTPKYNCMTSKISFGSSSSPAFYL